jgi:hypothetical protein
VLTSHACEAQELSAHADRVVDQHRRIEDYEPGMSQVRYQVLAGAGFLGLAASAAPLEGIISSEGLFVLAGRIRRLSVAINPEVVRELGKLVAFWGIPAAAYGLSQAASAFDPSSSPPAAPPLPAWVSIPVIDEQALIGECRVRRRDLCQALLDRGLRRESAGVVCQL